MNLYIQQTIQINFIRIGAVSNSSVFQIGSAGIIKPVSNLYNTGGFTGPAPKAQKAGMGPGAGAQAVPFGANGGQLQLFQAPSVPFVRDYPTK